MALSPQSPAGEGAAKCERFFGGLSRSGPVRLVEGGEDGPETRRDESLGAAPRAGRRGRRPRRQEHEGSAPALPLPVRGGPQISLGGRREGRASGGCSTYRGDPRTRGRGACEPLQPQRLFRALLPVPWRGKRTGGGGEPCRDPSGRRGDDWEALSRSKQLPPTPAQRRVPFPPGASPCGGVSAHGGGGRGAGARRAGSDSMRTAGLSATPPPSLPYPPFPRFRP